MSGTTKLSQHELRQLMRDRAKDKQTTRIESPLAKYDTNNRLWCVVCNTIINSETIWPSHLITKSHKKKVEELKRIQSKSHQPEVISKSLKRNLSTSNENEEIPKKVSKFENVAEFSKKERLIKESNAIQDVPKSEKPTIDPSIPQDFFDDGVSIQTEQTMEVDNASEEKTDLPQGFFDDPLQDARARKAVYKDPLEQQMELFRKEIAQETLVSDVIIEEDVEELQKEKTIFEIEEQISHWSKVDRFQKQIEQIHKRQEDNKVSLETDEESESDDETNLNDVNFWRSKQVFH